MEKLVPLHSLVITVGSEPVENEKMLSRHFMDYEIISADRIRYELVGNRDRKDIDKIVFAEIHRMVDTKLRLGERVVVNASNLRSDNRIALANIGISLGAPVFYLICLHDTTSNQIKQRFLAAEKDILRGDGIAEVIDLRNCNIFPISKLSLTNPVKELKKRFHGITAIGDIHGMHQSLLAAIEWARYRGNYALFMGDIVDYGQGTLECADEVYQTVMRGNGELIVGNHEKKIARWIDQNERGKRNMRLSDGNKVTIQALNNLGAVQRERWMARFKGLVSRSPLMLSIDNCVFTHAAVHPSWWSNLEPEEKNMETYSLFGEFEPQSVHPKRTYGWVDSIPENQTVFVGHNFRSTFAPHTQSNSLGGRAIFLDTGSGKGGHLSSVDLRFTSEGLKTENFNRH